MAWMKRHICNASVNDIFQIKLPPQGFILECHCNTDLLCMYIIHEQALILSFYSNEMEYISRNKAWISFLQLSWISACLTFWTFRCRLFSCSWSNFRCLSLSLLPAETGYIDPVLIEKYNTPGFVGCLSRVQFNSIAPLKAAIRSRGSAPVSHQGKLVESNCGASPLTIPPMSAATDPWHLDAGKHV